MMTFHPVVVGIWCGVFAFTVMMLFHYRRNYKKFQRMYEREYKSKEKAFKMAEEYREITLDLQKTCEGYKILTQNLKKDCDEYYERLGVCLGCDPDEGREEDA